MNFFLMVTMPSIIQAKVETYRWLHTRNGPMGLLNDLFHILNFFKVQEVAKDDEDDQ